MCPRAGTLAHSLGDGGTPQSSGLFTERRQIHAISTFYRKPRMDAFVKLF